MIIGGPSSQLLGGRVAAILKEDLALCEYSRFPDGEAYTQVCSDLDDGIVVIQSTPSDRDIIQLLQLLDVFRGRRIDLVVPYFGYARQDKQFKPGEPLSARAMAVAIDAFLEEGSRFFTVNIHDRSVLKYFKHEATDLDATPLLADEIKKMNLDDPVIISPDKGAVRMAKVAALRLGVDYDYLEKTRHSGTEVSMAPKQIDASGRDVVILDDMIATGGTMAQAISILKSNGAKRVYLGSVHPVLTGSAVLKLCRAGVESIIATDTLEKAVSTVSVARLIAEAVRP
jgi:ribose-phosphate pyrophosphokinase